jgi:hypothetical protein
MVAGQLILPLMGVIGSTRSIERPVQVRAVDTEACRDFGHRRGAIGKQPFGVLELSLADLCRTAAVAAPRPGCGKAGMVHSRIKSRSISASAAIT